SEQHSVLARLELLGRLERAEILEHRAQGPLVDVRGLEAPEAAGALVRALTTRHDHERGGDPVQRLRQVDRAVGEEGLLQYERVADARVGHAALGESVLARELPRAIEQRPDAAEAGRVVERERILLITD